MSNSAPVSRRSSARRGRFVTLVVAAAALAGLAAAGASSSSSATPGKKVAPGVAARKAPEQYLFSQDAKGGTFAPLAGQPGLYKLSLTGVSPAALYFSDRPVRVVGAVSIGKMLAGLFHKKGASPPNAAVNTLDAAGAQVLMGVELVSAAYDWKKKVLTYTVKKLKQGPLEDRVKGRTDTILPGKLGRTAVFIDTVYNDCDVNLSNWSDHDIPVMSQTLNNSHDSWDPAPTTSTTPADQGTMSYGSESGFARGCSNTVVFGDSQGTITIYVSDPYSGANSYSCTATGAYKLRGPGRHGPL